MKNNKSLGQHWLKDRSILDYIAASAVSDDQNTVCIEIGPGLGTLTSSLFKHFQQVIAIEIDSNLATNLPKSFPGKSLTVINQDVLQLESFSSLLSSPQTPYSIVGNIPYYITSPIIKKILTDSTSPQKIVLLIQKEVAERIAAPVGKHTVLSLFVQNYATVELGRVVPRNLFTPPPKVDSQVLILTPKPPVVPDELFGFIKICFSAPRKKLVANLSAALKTPKNDLKARLTETNLNPDARPADLTLENYQNLKKLLTN